MEQLPSIMAFLDHREYLEKVFSTFKANERMSLRAFAALCGSSQPSYLKHVLSGRLRFRVQAIPRIAKFLKLSSIEIRYFEKLVRFHEARTFEERDSYYRDLMNIKSASAHQKIEKSQYAYYSRWYHSAIRALIGYYRFYPGKSDYRDLGKQLEPGITAQQARSSVMLLEKLNLIKLNGHGYYEQSSPVVTTGPIEHSLEVTKFQAEMMKQAQDALHRCPAMLRDISTITLNISATGFEQARDKIIRMRKELISIAEESAGDDRVYQVNIQLFPLTKIKKAENK